MKLFRKATGSKNNLQMLSRLLIVAILVSIFAACFAQAALTEKTFVITDGDRVILHSSANTDPEIVLAEAGLALSDGDRYAVTENENGDKEIEIQRAKKITINCDGMQTAVETYDETVREVLKSEGISLKGDDHTSQPLNRDAYDGMVLDVVRVTHKTVEYDEEIPFGTDYYEEASIPAGQSWKLAEGVPGKIHRVAYVTYENGVEIKRQVVSEKTVSQPTNEIVLTADKTAGTKVGTAKVLSCLGTAYSCDGRPGITATGTVVHIGTVAVDPRVIPLHSKMFIVSNDGKYVYGYSTAEDTGGLIKGNRVDLYFNTTSECINFGARQVTVYVLSD